MRHFWVAAALCFAVAACKDTATSPTLPATFRLAPGGSASADGARVTFVRVESDSRCPIDVLCVTAGDATITIHVAAAGLDAEYQLSLFDASKRSVNHRGYVFTFMKLEPERDTRNQPTASDYRASIEIAR